MNTRIEEIIKHYGTSLTKEEISAVTVSLVDLVLLLHESNNRSDVIKRGIAHKKQKKLEKELKKELKKKVDKSN